MESNTCQAATKAGNRCKKKMSDGVYCKLHSKLEVRNFVLTDKDETLYKLISEAQILLDKTENIIKIKKLLQEGANPNYLPQYQVRNWRKLHELKDMFYRAIMIGDLEIIQLMIERGVDVNKFPTSYLMKASQLPTSEESLQINKLLLQRIEMTNQRIKTYVESLVVNDKKELLDYVLEKFDQKNHALKIAIDHGKLNLVEELIKLGATEFHLVPIHSTCVLKLAEILFDNFKTGLEDYISILPEHLKVDNLDFYKKLIEHYKTHKKFKELINEGFFHATRRFDIELMKYLSELGAGANYIQRHAFGCSDSLSIAVNLVQHSDPRFLERLMLISKTYKLNSEMSYLISEQISSIFDIEERYFIYENNVQEMLRILFGLGIPLSPDYTRCLDIKIGLLTERIFALKTSKSKKNKSLTEKLTSELDNLTQFRTSIQCYLS